MSERIRLLDHGYLELVESWGSDESIIAAARMSTSGSFRGWGPKECDECHGANRLPDEGCKKCSGSNSIPGDEKLLRYLWDHKHHTPFEMAGATFEVQAPIFVFREWHRHRVPFGYNEMSARYTPLPDVNYVPSAERLLIGSDGKNKQAGTVAGAVALSHVTAQEFQNRLDEMYKNQEAMYQWALKSGVPKELARVHLPVGRYSRMRVTGNLRGWLGFLKLRMAKDAQYEIRMYANAIADVLQQKFPRTMELFLKGAA